MLQQIDYQFVTDFVGHSLFQIIPLFGDGSNRKLYRIHYNKTTAVLIVFDKIAENKDFFTLTQGLQEIGVLVPHIYAIADSKKTYILEDLGDERVDTHFSKLKQEGKLKQIVYTYESILQTLSYIQINLESVLPRKIRQREMNQSVIQGYIDLFFTEFVGYYNLQTIFNEELQANLQTELVQDMVNIERNVIVLRDFQVRNIMFYNNSLVYIDYQEACKGTSYYDLASLLYASSSFLEEEQIEYLWKKFYSLHFKNTHTIEQFEKLLYTTVLLRRLHSLGIYSYLGNKQNKKHFLSKINPAIQSLICILERKSVLLQYKNKDFIKALQRTATIL